MKSVRPIQPPFLHEQPTITSKYDVMRRERLPGTGGMELEYRESPRSAAEDLYLTNETFLGQLLGVFFVVPLVIGPVVSWYGAYLFSPATYPLFALLSVLIGVSSFRERMDLVRALSWVVLPQLGFVILELSYSPSSAGSLRLLPIALMIVTLGFVADNVATHFAFFLTANPFLKREEILARRAWWRDRFRWFVLQREIERLLTEARAAEAEGRERKVARLRADAKEVEAIQRYPLRYLFVGYLGTLVLAGCPTWCIALLAIATSAFAASPNRSVDPQSLKLAWIVTLAALRGWLSWGQGEPPEGCDTPGLFQSPFGSATERAIATAVAMSLTVLVIVPPAHVWGAGEFLSPNWLWVFVGDALVSLVLPGVLFVTTLLIVSWKNLWTLHCSVAALEAEDVEFEPPQHVISASGLEKTP